MNKEFRIWNLNKKSWENPENFAVNLLTGEVLSFDWHTDNRKTWAEDSLYSYKIQQYTGLTDSTGKKIFEGDIVCEKITPEMAANGDSANVGRVFFAAGTFMIDGDGPLYDHTYSLTPDRLEDYLVIGNIFETPELLK